MELTFGDPATPAGPPRQPDGKRLAEVIGDVEPSTTELEAIGRELDARRQRVALLSIERSEAACRSVAAVTKVDAAGVLAETLAQLGAEVKKEFPRAMEFRRPGFDR